MARTPGRPESSQPGFSTGGVRFRLLHRGKEVPLDSGEYIIGRAPGSDILLDDALVSRRHARLLVNDTTALLEDMQSENGVFVNEQRIRRSVRLADGDRILVGTQELAFVVAPVDWDPSRSSGTVEIVPPASAPWRVTGKMHEGAPSTLEADAFQYLGDIAERMIRTGRGATAERLLRGHLEEVLAAAQSQGRLGRDIVDAAAGNALRLAVGLPKAAWIDFIIELHSALRMPPCVPVTGALRLNLRELPGYDIEKWRNYERILTARMPSLSASDQALARTFLWIEKPPA